MSAALRPRSRRHGLPDQATKPQIALHQLRAARAAGIEADVVLADAGYGNDTDFRDGITEIGLAYAVGIRVTWREGTNTKLAARFAAVRARPAHRDYKRSTPRSEEWCLIEWPADESEPTKYFLSTLPANISRRALVNTTKLRWRIERDYQDLKQELGLGHNEGRGWRGFHHHATLCIAAYEFLISEREAIPPLEPRRALLIEEPPVPDGYRPCGSPDPT